MEELVWMILVTLCLMWLLWRKQNLRTCEDVEASDLQLKTSFIRSLLEGSRVFGLESLFFALNSIHVIL